MPRRTSAKSLVVIGGVEQKAHCFVLDLPHSDACYVRAYPAATAEAWADGHVHAFAFFGRVPLSVLYDNDRCLVARILPDGTRKRATLFSGLLSHYVIEDRYGRPGKGNDKGSVEGIVGWSRRNFMVPLPRFATWDDFNAWLEEQCRKRQAEILRGHSETIGERLERDLEAMAPLPAAPFEACDQATGRVSSQALVRYRTNDYSVPVAYGHRDVWIRAYVDRVIIGCGGEGGRAHAYGRKARAELLGHARTPVHGPPYLVGQPRGQRAQLDDVGVVTTPTQPGRSPSPAGPGWNLRLRSWRPDDDIAKDTHDVVQAELGDCIAERAVVAVTRVGQDDTRRHTFLPCRADLRQRDLRLGGERNLGRHLGRRTACGVVRPRFRQVQLPGDRQRRLGARHRERDRDLAIVLLAELAAVLPGDPDGMRSLLRKPGVVEDPGRHRASGRHPRQHRLSDGPQQSPIVPR